MILLSTLGQLSICLSASLFFHSPHKRSVHSSHHYFCI